MIRGPGMPLSLTPFAALGKTEGVRNETGKKQ
jgi:hypothetical protein